MKRLFQTLTVLLVLSFFPSTARADLQIILPMFASTYMFPANGFMPFNVHRGTQTLLSLMLPGTLFDDPQGMACALLDKTRDPKAPLDDVVVTVIGVNSGDDSIFYNVGLKDLKKFGSPGAGAGQFRKSHGSGHPSQRNGCHRGHGQQPDHRAL